MREMTAPSPLYALSAPCTRSRGEEEKKNGSFDPPLKNAALIDDAMLRIKVVMQCVTPSSPITPLPSLVLLSNHSIVIKYQYIAQPFK